MAQGGGIKVRHVIIAQVTDYSLHLQVAEGKENINGQLSPIDESVQRTDQLLIRLKHNACSREDDIFWAHAALFHHAVILHNFPFHLIYMQSFPRWLYGLEPP